MRNALLISFFLLAAPFSFSQKNEANDVLLKKGYEILYDEPAQALKVGEHLIHNDSSDSESAQAYLLLSKSSLVSGNYTQALSNIRLALAKAELAENPKIRFETYLLAMEIYAALHLFEISKQYHNKAGEIATGNALQEKRLEAYRLFGSEENTTFSLRKAFAKNLTPNAELTYSFITKGTPSERLATDFEKVSQPDSAVVFYQKSVDYNFGSYWKMLALLDFSNYFLNKKDFPKAILLLEEALEKGKAIGNPYFQMTINGKLSSCYLAMGNKAKFREFKQKAGAAQNDYEAEVLSAINFAFESLQKDKEENLEAANETQQSIWLCLGIIAFVMLLLWLFVRWLFATRIRHESDIISYLRLILKSDASDSEQAKQATTNDAKQNYGIVEKTGIKSLSIPKETENLLLAKLEKFEAGKKYLNKDMSLAQMATLFETNTKYLSEIINKYKQKNINLYINELRIKYIVEKLKNDPKYLHYKVSYLAEECGFASHSSFSAVFKSITGITPNVFIRFLSEDRQEINKTEMA
jgi:AraC-like DNA-binding protein